MSVQRSPFLTTADVARMLGVSMRQVQKLIEVGRLPATKVGRDYLINPDDLGLVAERKRGRPSKAERQVDGALAAKKGA